MKVVINTCFGGFSLSHEAIMRWAEIKGIKVWPVKGKGGHKDYLIVPPEEAMSTKTSEEWVSMPLEERLAWNKRYSAQRLPYDRNIGRDDPTLIQVVEELGEKASGKYAKLKIVEIPDGIGYQIEEYDGNEHVAETHRTWG